jgi:hypothetical protein
VTVSRPEAAVAAGVLLLAGLGPLGCRTPGAAPPRRPLEGDIHFSARVPDVADRTAAELAAAAMVSDPVAAARALRRLAAIDTVLRAAEEAPTGLEAVSADLVNAMVDDPRQYRQATQALLDEDDLDPALRARLEQAERDDPLELAKRRMRDVRILELGRAFNAVAEPVGRSIMTQAVAPYRLASSALRYAVHLYTRPAMQLQERQALVHWRRFAAQNPDAPEVAEVKRRIRDSEARWHRLKRDRAVRTAKRALDAQAPGLALVYADRALRHRPRDKAAERLREQAQAKLRARREDLHRSVSASPEAMGTTDPQAAWVLARALLDPQSDPGPAARALLESDPDSPLADEARFALAIGRGEAGDEAGMWAALEDLAEAEPDESNMARHAASLASDATRNAYAAFQQARRADLWDRVRWVLLGPWYRGGPDRGLPRAAEWVLGLPSVTQSIGAMPIRLLQIPFQRRPGAGRAALVHARRYLVRRPAGAHADELRAWVESYEASRGNWLGALAVAEGEPALDAERRRDLREKAAKQALDVASRESRRDTRNQLLRRVTREFPETAAGRAAGRLARAELDESTPLHIRISRGFLLENPQVAGPQGLGLRPGLLDGNPANGELHPEGVSLLGGRVLELSFVGPSGDEKRAPTHVRETLSDDRLARLVSQLEETSFRNELLDPDNDVGPDPERDVYFERVRLGLADAIDPRATTESRYTYKGMRERYGLVRGRESILPFDLVLQGSLTDLSLGAFPRIRKPRETPDAFLYR